ncbi:MAG: hypothetical protein F4060_04520 [Holophagales bacterium]|nr:hypothetical protein [Holophagales bacterium]MYG29768.1 hypothetical protein [Holophagales bacterium]MYI79182.1 hypothetical protein [Holophagales bacterium]
MTEMRPAAAPTIKDIGAKVIAKEYGEWRYSWRVVVEATPQFECYTRVSFVDADDFEIESDSDCSTVPSSGRLVVRGVTGIEETLARTIRNTLASIEVYPKNTA